MSKSTSILVYGHDATLLSTRSQVLEHAGFRVLQAFAVGEVEVIVGQHEISLLLVCHSVPLQDCSAAINLCAEIAPGMKVLCVRAGKPTCSEPSVSAFDGPGRLIEEVTRLQKTSEAASVQHQG